MEDENNFKILVHGKKGSKEIQKILLDCGFMWNGRKDREMEEFNQWALYFYTGENSRGCEFGRIRQSGSRDIKFFRSHPNTEVNLKQLRNKDFQMKLTKLLILNNLGE